MQRIFHGMIVPAVRAPSGELTLRAVNAIVAGGITTIEIPVTVPDALRVINLLRQKFPDLLVGAGTVLDEATACAALMAGAQFIVSPSLHPQVIAFCKRYSIPTIPGAMTPTEVLAAWELGADMVKVFPASAMGGAGYIKALLAPLPQVRLMPMGGVNIETASDYLQSGAAALGVGADLVDIAALRSNNDDKITQKAQLYLAAVRESTAQQSGTVSSVYSVH